MYKTKVHISKIIGKIALEGETIESKVARMLNNKEPIKDGAPSIYTDRKEGVMAGYDIRTDRFEIAIDAMDVGMKSDTAKREKSIGEAAKENMIREDGKPETIQATGGETPN